MFPVNKFPPWGFSSNLSPHYKNHAWMQEQFQVFDSEFTFQFALILLLLRKYLFKVNNKDTEATFIDFAQMSLSLTLGMCLAIKLSTVL